MYRTHTAVLLGMLILTTSLCTFAFAQEIGPDVEYEARGVWITLSLALSKQTLPEIVNQLHQHNLNLVLVSYQADQPMKEFAEACRQAGIEVHIWVVPRSLVPECPDELKLHAYSTKAKDFTALRPAFFMEGYKQLAAAGAVEIVGAIPCDGLHLDGVRYGVPWTNLSPEAIAQFAKDTGTEIKDIRTDIIKVDSLRPDNVGKSREWAGPHLTAWARWRCQVVADLFGAVAQAVKATDPRLSMSNACMTDWGSGLYYGVDYALLAPHLDFFTPMAYYNRYGKNAAWSIRRCQQIAIQAQAANPNCRVYAGVATYSHSCCRTWIVQVVREAREAGKLTAEEVTENELMSYGTGPQMLQSASWLYRKGIISTDTYARMLNVIITDEEIMQAVRLMRAGRDTSLPGADEYEGEGPVEGIVFFRYHCMFPDNTEAVVGNLWDKLRPAFPKPAGLPHRQ